MENWDFLELIGKILLALLALFGTGAILKDFINRLWKKSDDRETVHASNQAKIIEADDKFQERILKRLEKLESELKEVQEKLTVQLVANAELRAENTFLKEKEQNHQTKIKELADINTKQAIKIVNLENQVQSFETAMQIQKAQIEDLNLKFNNLQTKRKTD